MQVMQGSQGGLIKAWVDGVSVEDQARKQLDNMAAMPFIHKHIAIMHDVHWGMGATVGSVIPTIGAIIPGSMGAKSFIVRGKGNPESFCSCSHGAGRAMSRTQAKKQFTIADHIAAMGNVEARTDEDVIDETPGAYKDIDAVMQAQSDLVEIVHTLKQVVCVKG